MAQSKLPKYVTKLLNKTKGAVIKLDLGCGDAKQAGFIGLDNRKLPGVDIITDVETRPLPLPSTCAVLAMARNLIEYIEPKNFIGFMNEVWRVLKVDGQFLILTPYAGSTAWLSDPLIINGVTAKTWKFFDPTSPNYKLYSPKPWRLEACYFRQEGNMEVLLIKCKETK